jgi:hypothetical protein
MNKTETSSLVEVTLMPASEEAFKGNDIPERSKLYGLVPCGLETVWTASLTSYLNRLTWHHHVPPRHPVAQEISSRLSQGYSRNHLSPSLVGQPQ